MIRLKGGHLHPNQISNKTKIFCSDLIASYNVNKMGIPERRKREKERRRQAIIISARKWFKKHGFSQTSIGNIAADADLSTGTIYLYFNSKEDLYAAVLMKVLEWIKVRFIHIDNQNLDNVIERLNSMTEVLTDSFNEEPQFTIDLLHLMSQEKSYRISGVNHAALIDLFNKTRNISSNLLERSLVRSSIPHATRLKLSDIFWSTIIGVIVNENGKKNLYNTNVDVRDKIETIFSILKRGLRSYSV